MAHSWLRVHEKPAASVGPATKGRCIFSVKRPVGAQALPSLQGFVSRLPGFHQQVKLQDSAHGFSDWLQKRGFPVEQQKVITQDLPGQGRGLVARAPVQQGSLLLAVPQDLVIFPQTAAEESCLAQLLSQEDCPLPDWSLLALFLAEQKYLLSSSGGSGKWGPYMSVLPQPPVGTVLDWTEGEVNTLLAGSGLLHKAQTIRSAADLVWSDLQPLLSAGKQQGLCPADMFSKADIQWAVGICLSRSVRLDDLAGEPIVLVPWADFINHDVSSQAFLVWDERQQAVVLKPDRSYKAGEQVFISYGPKSSGELLLSYGFCAAPGSNPNDAAHMTFTISADDTFKQEKQQALAARSIPASETFAVRIDALPAGLISYLAFCSAQVQSASEVEHLAERLFDQGDLPVVNGVSCEQIALTALARECKARLQGYPQQQDADKLLAATVLQGGGYEERQALMAAIRVRERQILSRTEFVARQRVRELRR